MGSEKPGLESWLCHLPLAALSPTSCPFLVPSCVTAQTFKGASLHLPRMLSYPWQPSKMLLILQGLSVFFFLLKPSLTPTYLHTPSELISPSFASVSSQGGNKVGPYTRWSAWKNWNVLLQKHVDLSTGEEVKILGAPSRVWCVECI